ncbi:MAG: hypothetical protein ABJ275_03240 [Maricaulaceae bacterium]
MSGEFYNKSRALFWMLGAVFLIWNIIGCYFYYLDQTLPDAAYAEAYGDALAAIRHQYPIWSVASYAVAVWGGLLATLLYLLRNRWASPLFVMSLIMAIISFIWGFTNAEYKAAAGSQFWVMPAVVVTLGCVEVWWSRKKVADGTLS